MPISARRSYGTNSHTVIANSQEEELIQQLVDGHPRRRFPIRKLINHAKHL